MFLFSVYNGIFFLIVSKFKLNKHLSIFKDSKKSTNGFQQRKNGCRRPIDIQSAWVYVKREDDTDMLIDPFQPFLPNNSVVHFKCAMRSSSSDEHRKEASAIICQNGEWVALLSECGKKNVSSLFYKNA